MQYIQAGRLGASELIKRKDLEVLTRIIPAVNEAGSTLFSIQSISPATRNNSRFYLKFSVGDDHSADRTEGPFKGIGGEDNKVRYQNNYYPNGFGFAVR